MLRGMAFVLALLLAGPALADDAVSGRVPLVGQWMPGDGAAGEAAATTKRAHAFDPHRLQAFGRPPGGATVLLYPRAGAWPQEPLVLAVESPGFQRVTLHSQGGAAVTTHLLDDARRRWPGYGRLAFDLPEPPADGAPLRLHVDAHGVVPSPMTFEVRRVPAHMRVETQWLAFATACFATMLATAVIALVFGARLRDTAFAYYALYVVTYALIQATQTGYLVRPLGWSAMADALPAWGRAVTTVSVVSAVLFVDRFAELRRRAPSMRRWLRRYCVAMLVLVAIGYVPALQALARALINPLLILGGPLVLAAAVVAARRGSRYALLFLVGWLPLLGVTVLGSLQLYGVAPTWTWSDDAALATGAFEAIVLSLGLAERAASVRRQRDQARALAETDPLTGVLNRRAWREYLHAQLSDHAASGLSVLFLDLDHFKRVNDRLGHQGGDRVLQLFVEVLRETVRGHDVIGRYGGEEFVVGLVETGPAEARVIAERVRAGLHARAAAVGTGMPLTVSIGIATLHAGETLEELLRRADAALYAAKDAGRDRVMVG